MKSSKTGRRSPVVPLDEDERALLSSVERGEWLVVGRLSTAKELDASALDVLESTALADDARKPTLRTPSVTAFVRAVRPSIVVPDADAGTAIQAMRNAAEKRVERGLR